MGDYLEVSLDQLVPNPDNPRDTLGDLDMPPSAVQS